MTRVDRATFINNLLKNQDPRKHASINLNTINESDLRQQLQRARKQYHLNFDIDEAIQEFYRIAGEDARITVGNELSTLYKFIDNYLDRSGSSSDLLLKEPKANGLMTPSGVVHNMCEAAIEVGFVPQVITAQKPKPCLPILSQDRLN